MEYKVLKISDEYDSSGYMLVGHRLYLRAASHKYFEGFITPLKFGDKQIHQGSKIHVNKFTYDYGNMRAIWSNNYMDIHEYNVK